MTFAIENDTIEFFSKSDGVIGIVAKVRWERKWYGKIKLNIQYVSRHCNMNELTESLNLATAVIKKLSRTVG